MEGALDEIIDALIHEDQQRKLKGEEQFFNMQDIEYKKEVMKQNEL